MSKITPHKADDQKTLTVHWTGTAWTKVASPNPGRDVNQLSGVSADSASDAWAVGYYFANTASGTLTPLILHWNGTAWAVASRHPTGAQLSGTSAISGSDAWAVGEYSKARGVTDTLILHWNGITWTTT